MSSARKDEWEDEKTVANAEPAERFAAALGRERQGRVDHDPLSETHERVVPSDLLRVAADPDGTLPVATDSVPSDFSPLPAPVPAGPLPPSSRSGLAIAALVAVGIFGFAVAILGLAYLALR